MNRQRLLLAGGCLLIMAGSSLAQNYYKAEQQAHRDSSMNDAEQQRIANAANAGAGAAAPATPGAAAPMDPQLQVTMKNIGGLQKDFAALIAVADKPEASDKMALLNDLSQASQGTKATSDSVKKLADDISTALVGQKKLTVPQQTRLAQQVHALFNSSHLSATQQQTLLTSVQKTLTDAGASLDAAVDVAIDLKTVISETK
jgi:hypothetical protein